MKTNNTNFSIRAALALGLLASVVLVQAETFTLSSDVDNQKNTCTNADKTCMTDWYNKNKQYIEATGPLTFHVRKGTDDSTTANAFMAFFNACTEDCGGTSTD